MRLSMFRTLAFATPLFLAASAQAQEQFVLFDITYTHDATADFHHNVSGATLKQPDNWTSPIDYASGTIHFYQEVMTKPTPIVTIIDFCFISSGYGCIETLPYTKIGLNETERSMAAGMHWYQRNQINFTRRMSSIQMVIKDPATYTNGCPGKQCVPSKMRFVATLVPPGATYKRPTPTPGFDPGDGGAPPSDPVDAGGSTPTPSPDAGGSTPTPSPDAATSEPKPTTPKPDAGTGGSTKPPATEPEDPDPEPAARRSSGGCSYGSAGGGAGLLIVLAAAGLLRRRRTR